MRVLEFGIVGVNDMVPATAEAPFGGTKSSGFGREGSQEGLVRVYGPEVCVDRVGVTETAAAANNRFYTLSSQSKFPIVQ